MRYLAVEQIVNSTQLIPLESKRSFSELFNPEDSEVMPPIYEWNNIKLTQHSRAAEFSNKNLRDEELFQEVEGV
jgi:hypothetical protein